MPIRKPRLTKGEKTEYETMSSRLEKMHIGIGSMGTGPKLKRFVVTQVDREFARVHDLPDGSTAVTLGAKLTILSHVMFIEALLFPEWDDCPLELDQPREHRYFKEFIMDSPAYRPQLLNDFLVDHPIPLPTSQRKGLIIAAGWSALPARYRDENPVNFELYLVDEQETEYRYSFIARVDRRLKHEYERRRPDPQLVAERIKNRVPLFEQGQTVIGQCSTDSSKLENGRLTVLQKYRDTIH